MREAVSSRRRGSMASEKCGLVTKPLHAAPQRALRWNRGEVARPHRCPVTQGQTRRNAALRGMADRCDILSMTGTTGMTGTTNRLGRHGRSGRSENLPVSQISRPATTPAGRPTHLLPLLVMPRAARRPIFRPGTLPAHPWRASAPAARGQKAPGHHYPHHQNGHQYQNIPHGGLLLAYVCRSGRVIPAISGASKSLRPPLPDGNSVRIP